MASSTSEQSTGSVGLSITLPSFDLNTAERTLCVKALATAGSIVEAAQLLGCTRHALKRRIIKHRIQWPLADNTAS